MKNLMFVLYWCLKILCPDAYPMVRHDNEHNDKREMMEETLSDMHAQSHYYRNTHTHTHADTDNTSSFASLQLH